MWIVKSDESENTWPMKQLNISAVYSDSAPWLL